MPWTLIWIDRGWRVEIWLRDWSSWRMINWFRIRIQCSWRRICRKCRWRFRRMRIGGRRYRRSWSSWGRILKLPRRTTRNRWLIKRRYRGSTRRCLWRCRRRMRRRINCRRIRIWDGNSWRPQRMNLRRWIRESRSWKENESIWIIRYWNWRLKEMQGEQHWTRFRNKMINSITNYWFYKRRMMK